jgi:hypothetical protein
MNDLTPVAIFLCSDAFLLLFGKTHYQIHWFVNSNTMMSARPQA